MVDIKQLQSLNDVFSAVMRRIFLQPGSSDPSHNDITWAQKKILILLEEQGALKMSEVARQISVTLSGATAVVDRMVRAGLVVREPDPTDRRVIRITSTDQGRAVVLECMDSQQRCFQEILEQLPQERRIELLSAFEQIHQILGEIEAGNPAAQAARGVQTDSTQGPASTPIPGTGEKRG